MAIDWDNIFKVAGTGSYRFSTYPTRTSQPEFEGYKTPESFWQKLSRWGLQGLEGLIWGLDLPRRAVVGGATALGETIARIAQPQAGEEIARPVWNQFTKTLMGTPTETSSKEWLVKRLADWYSGSRQAAEQAVEENPWKTGITSFAVDVATDPLSYLDLPMSLPKIGGVPTTKAGREAFKGILEGLETGAKLVPKAAKELPREMAEHIFSQLAKETPEWTAKAGLYMPEFLGGGRIPLTGTFAKVMEAPVKALAYPFKKIPWLRKKFIGPEAEELFPSIVRNRSLERGMETTVRFGEVKHAREVDKLIQEAKRETGLSIDEVRRLVIRAETKEFQKMTPRSVMKVVEKMQEGSGALLQKQIDLGMKISELDSDTMIYMTRVTTPEARKILRRDVPIFKNAPLEFNPEHDYMLRRELKDSIEITNLKGEAGELIIGGVKLPPIKKFFETDPAKIVATYGERVAPAIGAAVYYKNTISSGLREGWLQRIPEPFTLPKVKETPGLTALRKTAQERAKDEMGAWRDYAKTLEKDLNARIAERKAVSNKELQNKLDFEINQLKNKWEKSKRTVDSWKMRVKGERLEAIISKKKLPTFVFAEKAQKLKDVMKQEKLTLKGILAGEKGKEMQEFAGTVAGEKAKWAEKVSARKGMETLAQMSRQFRKQVVQEENVLARQGTADLLAKGWKTFSIPELKDYMIAPEVADAVIRHIETITQPKELGKFLKTFDRVMSVWRVWTLPIWIGYHTRNLVSNVWNNFIAGVTNPNDYYRGFRYVIGKDVEVNSPLYGKMGGAEFRKLMDAEDIARSGFIATESITKRRMPMVGERGVADWARYVTEDNPVLNCARVLGTGNEDMARTAHIIGKLEQGSSWTEAVRSMKATLYDYKELTGFEREVMRRIAPFYSWSRKNIPWQVESLFTRPRGVLGMERLKTAFGMPTKDQMEDKFVPEWVKDNLGIATKKVDTDQGTEHQYFLLGGWIPTADIVKLASPAEQLMMLVNPIAKLAIELQFNKASFTGMPIEETPGQVREVLGKQMSPALAYICKSFRVISELDRFNPWDMFGYEDKGMMSAKDEMSRWLRICSGVKLYTVNEQKMRRKYKFEMMQDVRAIDFLRKQAVKQGNTELADTYSRVLLEYKGLPVFQEVEQ